MTRRTLLQQLALLFLASESKLLNTPAFALRKTIRNPMIEENIDWPQFMARHDLTWESIPTRWEEGAFVGNGLLGAMIFASDDKRALRFHIGRSDVADKG